MLRRLVEHLRRWVEGSGRWSAAVVVLVGAGLLLVASFLYSKLAHDVVEDTQKEHGGGVAAELTELVKRIGEQSALIEDLAEGLRSAEANSDDGIPQANEAIDELTNLAEDLDENARQLDDLRADVDAVVERLRASASSTDSSDATELLSTTADALINRGADSCAPEFDTECKLWTFAATTVFGVGLFVLVRTLGWRSKLTSGFAARRGVSPPRLNFLTPAIFFGLALVAINIEGNHYLRDSPSWIAWLVAFPASVSLLDIHAFAIDRGREFLPTTRSRIERVTELRRMVDNFLASLGAVLTVWAFFWTADQHLKSSAGDPKASTQSAILTAAGITALLAILYVLAALAVDRVAQQMLRDKTDDLDWDGDYAGAKALHDLYKGEIGLDQPLMVRFENGLSVLAPFLGAVLTSRLTSLL